MNNLDVLLCADVIHHAYYLVETVYCLGPTRHFKALIFRPSQSYSIYLTTFLLSLTLMAIQTSKSMFLCYCL